MTDLSSLSPESSRSARVAIQVVAFLSLLIALLYFSNPALGAMHAVKCDCTNGYPDGTCQCTFDEKVKLHPLSEKYVNMKCTNQTFGQMVWSKATVNNNFEEYCTAWVVDQLGCQSGHNESCGTGCYNPDPTSNHSVRVKTITCKQVGE